MTLRMLQVVETLCTHRPSLLPTSLCSAVLQPVVDLPPQAEMKTLERHVDAGVDEYGACCGTRYVFSLLWLVSCVRL